MRPSLFSDLDSRIAAHDRTFNNIESGGIVIAAISTIGTFALGGGLLYILAAYLEVL